MVDRKPNNINVVTKSVWRSLSPPANDPNRSQHCAASSETTWRIFKFQRVMYAVLAALRIIPDRSLPCILHH